VKPNRKVYIMFTPNCGGAWLVCYAERRKGQKYCAARFTADDHDRAFVERWVAGRPELELVPEPAPGTGTEAAK
jgi:hypothetical protein